MDFAKNFISNTIILIGVSLACYLLLGQIIEVSGNSMDPTVKSGQWVLAEKISPKFGEFKRGEIVVFKSPEKENRLLIKRIVGLPGETIKIRYGIVYINNEALQEKYLTEDTITLEGKTLLENQIYTISENQYIVLGDNRENSTDSRDYGAINKESVLGRPLFIYKPFKDFKLLLLRQE